MADENKPVMGVRPNHDEALKRQVNAEAPTADVRVNPNPVGAVVETDGEATGVYLGTDPIYQNSSTVANQPFVSDDEDSADAVAEGRVLELHDLSEADKSELAPDFGTGGYATKAQGTEGREVFRVVYPGQEGYDKEKAEAQNGPPLRVYTDDKPSDSSSNEESKESQVNDSGTNFGSTVTNFAPPASPDDNPDGAGDKPTDDASAKPDGTDGQAAAKTVKKKP